MSETDPKSRALQELREKAEALGIDPEALKRLEDLSKSGDTAAVMSLFAVWLPLMRQMASSRLRLLPRGHTMVTGDLVNTAFVRIFTPDRGPYVRDSLGFLAYCRTAMILALKDHGRGRIEKIPLGDGVDIEFDIDHLLSLDLQMLREFEDREPAAAEILTLWNIHGLTQPEIGRKLGLTLSQVRTRCEQAQEKWKQFAG